MSNRLSMAKINSIETLHRSGHSNREIARLLAIDRGTVNKYIKRLKAENQNQPNPQPDDSEFGVLVETSAAEVPIRNGPQSSCEPYREIIEQKLDQ